MGPGTVSRERAWAVDGVGRGGMSPGGRTCVGTWRRPWDGLAWPSGHRTWGFSSIALGQRGADAFADAILTWLVKGQLPSQLCKNLKKPARPRHYLSTLLSPLCQPVCICKNTGPNTEHIVPSAFPFSLESALGHSPPSHFAVHQGTTYFMVMASNNYRHPSTAYLYMGSTVQLLSISTALVWALGILHCNDSPEPWRKRLVLRACVPVYFCLLFHMLKS